MTIENPEDEPPMEPETPGGDPAGQDEAGGYAEPSMEALGVEAADDEAESLTAEYGADLVALKAEIESKLLDACGEANEAASVQMLDSGSNITGVGLMDLDPEALMGGADGLPGAPAMVVYTVEPCSNEALMAEVAQAAGTRALSTMSIVQVPTGVIDAESHRFRMRPAPGGISVGHFRVTAGTLGCLVTGNRAPRNRRRMILSNNHVIANSNSARIGDCISQPGRADGGSCPRDQIAVLERFARINFARGSFNYIDAATGWAWPDRVRPEHIYLSGGRRRLFRVGRSPVAPRVNMIVGKTGRTTQLTQGRITAVNVTVNVNFGGGRVAQFRDQIAVRGFNGNFSAGGDSGSLIWQWTRGLPPVALLFAGGGGTTFGNRITRVLGGLDVRII